MTTAPSPAGAVWLHHTVTGFGAAAVRQIQNGHMDDRDFCDIGYNWIIDPRDAVIYQGRGLGVRGAHTIPDNDAQGVAVLGNWDDDVPTDSDLESIAQGFVTLYNLDAWIPTSFTGGHRDVWPTACPGQHLYDRLPDLNERTRELIEGGPVSGHDGTYKNTWKGHISNLPDWAEGIWDRYVEAGGTSDKTSFQRLAWRFDLAWIYVTFIEPLKATVDFQAEAIANLETRVAQLEAAPGPGPHEHEAKVTLS